MIKVIVTYASAGAGHFKAAQAIYNYLKEERKELDVKIVDALQYSTPLLRLSYARGYPFLVKYLRVAWKGLFWVTRLKLLRPLSRKIASFLNRINTPELADFLTKENPDYIISTHFLTSEISASLKRCSRTNARLITVITDFGVHPFWVSGGTDLYITASESSKELLIAEGVKPENIRPFGIPVNPVFLQHYDRDELAAKFGLSEDKFNVLIVTGSFGIGPIEEIVGLLHSQTQLLVVCARNHRLYKRLKKKNYPQCLVFGFVDNIQELMAVADVIITKPGGMSISESLVMDLLPVFISPIPGQETENVRVLAKAGIGVYPRKASDIRKLILELKEGPDKLRKIKAGIAVFKKPYAVRDISDVIR